MSEKKKEAVHHMGIMIFSILLKEEAIKNRFRLFTREKLFSVSGARVSVNADSLIF